MIPRSRHQDRWTLLERWTPGFQRELNYWNRDDTEEEIKAQKPFQLMKENHSWGFLLHVFLGGTVPIPMVHWSRPNVWYVCYNSHVGETRDWSNDTPQREFHPPWLSPGVGWSLLSQSRNLVTGARRNGIPKAQMVWCCFFNTYSIIILYHDKRNNDDMGIQRERRQCIHILFIQRRYGIFVPIWVMRFSKDRFLRAWKQRWDLFNQLRWWRDWSSCFLVVQMDIRSVGTPKVS